jgi:hypothetical protein
MLPNADYPIAVLPESDIVGTIRPRTSHRPARDAVVRFVETEVVAAPWIASKDAAFPGRPALAAVLDPLPRTHSWAGNHECDTVFRFDGPARTAVAVAGTEAVWVAATTFSPDVRDRVAVALGLSTEDLT